MKILALLLFLVSCGNSSPRFKAGDCIRSLGVGDVNIYSIKEVTKRNYIFTAILKSGSRTVETDLIAARFYYLDEYKESSKIECPEVK